MKRGWHIFVRDSHLGDVVAETHTDKGTANRRRAQIAKTFSRVDVEEGGPVVNGKRTIRTEPSKQTEKSYLRDRNDEEQRRK